MSTSTAIQLPAGFGASILAIASQQLSNFSEPITIIVGVLLAMLAIDFLVGAFHRGK